MTEMPWPSGVTVAEYSLSGVLVMRVASLLRAVKS
jgi:hypothetical protein